MLTGYIGKRNEHQIVIEHRAATSVAASDFSAVDFLIAESAGGTAIVSKAKADLTQLTAPAGKLAYQINLAAADTSAQTVPRVLYWQLSLTRTGEEPIIAATGLYDLKTAT